MLPLPKTGFTHTIPSPGPRLACVCCPRGAQGLVRSGAGAADKGLLEQQPHHAPGVHMVGGQRGPVGARGASPSSVVWEWVLASALGSRSLLNTRPLRSVTGCGHAGVEPNRCACCSSSRLLTGRYGDNTQQWGRSWCSNGTDRRTDLQTAHAGYAVTCITAARPKGLARACPRACRPRAKACAGASGSCTWPRVRASLRGHDVTNTAVVCASCVCVAGVAAGTWSAWRRPCRQLCGTLARSRWGGRRGWSTGSRIDQYACC